MTPPAVSTGSAQAGSIPDVRRPASSNLLIALAELSDLGSHKAGIRRGTPHNKEPFVPLAALGAHRFAAEARRDTQSEWQQSQRWSQRSQTNSKLSSDVWQTVTGYTAKRRCRLTSVSCC